VKNTVWIIRQKINGRIVLRKTSFDETVARALVKALTGIGIVELERSIAGIEHRMHIEVFQ
jgi:hypothetical protein